MRQTRIKSKRFPRKLKKEIIERFGRRQFQSLLGGYMQIKPKVVMNYHTHTSTFVGWTTFYTINDGNNN